MMKKTILTLLAGLPFVGMAQIEAPEFDDMDDEIGQGYRLWDLNNDGVVKIPDAQIIIDKIIGK